jgi:hypothetical protein
VAFFVARHVKDGSVPRLGVVDLRGCSGESCLVYSHSSQVKLRRDLLLRVASVMCPSMGVFSYCGLKNYVVFNCKSVVYLIVQLGFMEYVKTLCPVHHSMLVKYMVSMMSWGRWRVCFLVGAGQIWICHIHF